MMDKLIIFSILILTCFYAKEAKAHHRTVSIAEIAQKADAILIGTADYQKSQFTEEQRSIFTNIHFKEVELIHAKDKFSQAIKGAFTLRHAGGTVDDVQMYISNMPHFEMGSRYLIFVKNDGKTYANPLVGGDQAIFKILKDEHEATEYVLNASQRAILGLDTEDLTFSDAAVEQILGGKIIYREQEKDEHRFMTVPTASDPADSASLPIDEANLGQAVTLKAFKQFILEEALKAKVEQPRLRYGTKGKFHTKDGKAIDLETLTPLYDPNEKTSKPAEHNQLEKGGTLGWCGVQDLNIVMEQLPSSWWGFTINDNAMWAWNKYMDMFRYVSSDGNINSSNGENEFAGWWNNKTLNDVYGFDWDGALAYCISWSGSGCRRITETDVIYNPAYSWTSDFGHSLGNFDVINLLPVTMHELGHCWGYQRKTYEETYDYDRLSVMHAYYSSVVEDGWGIHSVDAHLVRRAYKDQKTVPNIRDLGCESYYARDGLKNATTDKTYYSAGQSIAIRNFVVENMSKYNTSNVRVRFFLSSNKNITTSDRQMGGYWYWNTFNAESYSRHNYNTYIPSNTPSGWYYVGAIVSRNGSNYDGDDFSRNNRTFLYKRIYVYGSNANGGNTGRSALTTNDVKTNIYPNPSGANDYFNLELDNIEATILTLRVVNQLGQIVEERLVNTDDTIQFGANLAKGQYQVQLIGENAIVSEQKVVKL